ncbi:MAG: LamG domain-containing protein, partial [Planctomycetota bacterium]
NRKQVGGLIGYHAGRTHYTLLTNSYSYGTVTGGGSKQGNLVGDADGSYVDRCYSCGNGKALIGYNWENPVITNSYWDKDKGASSSIYGGTPKSTAEMMQQATFVNWDFVNIWGILENGAYPFLIAFEYKELVGLEITGPWGVVENFSAGYKAIAFYKDGSTRDVTNLALWAVEPNIAANIDEKGVLITKDVVKDRSVTILAGYTEGDVTFDADKVVNIFHTCPTGAALQFDGVDDYIGVSDDHSMRVSQYDSFSVSLWARPFSNGWLLSKMRANQRRGVFGYSLMWETSTCRFRYIVEKSWVKSTSAYTTYAPQGTWHYITAIYDNKEMKIYLNGQLHEERHFEQNTGDTEPDKHFVMGARSWDYTIDGYSNCIIDEVAVYNRALSDEEIQANMYMRLAGDEPNLVAYWDFDEGEGQIVYDLSGNGNHGYLGWDPCAVEESDPVWIESDAPIDICSLYQIAILANDGAVERKTALLEELPDGLDQEWMVYEALEEWLESGDYGALNYGDIVTAKQKIHSAIQHEEQSILALEQSVEKLKDALSSLGYEPEPLTLNQETLALSDLEWREPVPVADVNTDFAEELTPFMSIEPYELAVIRAEDAIARKVEVLEKINAELEKEWTAYEALEEWLESGYYGDLYKGDIVTAKQKIYSAIQHEEQFIDALEKSIEKLEDALSALGYDPPGQASNPTPGNGAVNVDTNADLSWTAGSKAISHDIYFGITNPPPFISNQTAATFDPGTMIGDIRYYWRIDEVNPSWTTTGTVWTFTTILTPPTPPP